ADGHDLAVRLDDRRDGVEGDRVRHGLGAGAVEGRVEQAAAGAVAALQRLQAGAAGGAPAETSGGRGGQAGGQWADPVGKVHWYSPLSRGLRYNGSSITPGAQTGRRGEGVTPVLLARKRVANPWSQPAARFPADQTRIARPGRGSDASAVGWITPAYLFVGRDTSCADSTWPRGVPAGQPPPDLARPGPRRH